MNKRKHIEIINITKINYIRENKLGERERVGGERERGGGRERERKGKRERMRRGREIERDSEKFERERAEKFRLKLKQINGPTNRSTSGHNDHGNDCTRVIRECERCVSAERVCVRRLLFFLFIFGQPI